MSFSLDISRWVAKTKTGQDALVRAVVLELGTRIVERSPVGNPSLWKSKAPAGYVGGRFRANWQYKFGAPATGVLDAVDRSGSLSNARILAGVSAAPGAGVHYLSNNLPYAQALENGHSTQAPSGMVGLAVVDFQQIVREASK